MEEIVKDVYVVKGYSSGDMNCCIYMVDTKSDDGLVLIDAGLYIEPIQSIEKDGFDVKNIKHCLITHSSRPFRRLQRTQQAKQRR